MSYEDKELWGNPLATPGDLTLKDKREAIEKAQES
jgi:hypothetical protein